MESRQSEGIEQKLKRLVPFVGAKIATTPRAFAG
jgi:hypothetical protein